MVSDLQTVHPTSYGSYDSGNLMSEEERKGEASFDGSDVLIRMAQATGLDVDEDFMIEWVRNFDVCHPEWSVDLFEYGRFQF